MWKVESGGWSLEDIAEDFIKRRCTWQRRQEAHCRTSFISICFYFLRKTTKLNGKNNLLNVMAVQKSGWGVMWRKYHALVRVFGGISKGLTLCRTVAWEYSWRRKNLFILKDGTEKWAACPGLQEYIHTAAQNPLEEKLEMFIQGLWKLCSLESYLYLNTQKSLVTLKNLGYFLCTTFFLEYLCTMFLSQGLLV